MGNSSSSNMDVVLEAKQTHTATVIFLHGLGDTGNGWAPAFATIQEPHIKYIFPTANVMPVSLNGGMRMHSWFDILGLEPNSPQDEQGIKAASKLLQSHIANEEKKGIPRHRIVVGGFSQGGALSLYSSFAVSQKPLGGIIALSSWLPMHQEFPKCVSANQETPILQCHGGNDPLVPQQIGVVTGGLIKSFNSKHEMKIYPDMGHSSSEQELQDMKQFIAKHLPAT